MLRMSGAISVRSSMIVVRRSLHRLGLSSLMGFTPLRLNLFVRKKSMKWLSHIPRSFRPYPVLNVNVKKEKKIRKSRELKNREERKNMKESRRNSLKRLELKWKEIRITIQSPPPGNHHHLPRIIIIGIVIVIGGI